VAKGYSDALQPINRGGGGSPQVEGGVGLARGFPSLTKHPPLPIHACGVVVRPCPHQECRHHLQLQDPQLKRGPKNKAGPVGEETCALDVADEGSKKLHEVGVLLGITRERVRQIEVGAIAKLRRNFPDADVLGLLGAKGA
jgi:hypothetical protein